MNIRTPLSLVKRRLANLLASGDIKKATEYFINAPTTGIRTDAGFIALAHNKPEFIDVIFNHIELLRTNNPTDLLKQAQFASREDHYKSLADVTIPHVINNQQHFLEDLFSSVVYSDNAIFLNWLLDNGHNPPSNYALSDDTETYTLLDVAGAFKSYKCISVLIERGFETRVPTRLKDTAWAYPYDEDMLNTTQQWELMLKYVEENEDPVIVAEWADNMIKSGRNAHFALLSILSLHCDAKGMFFEPYNINVLVKNSLKMSAYLDALSNRSFSSLSSSEAALALFFNKPLLTEEWDVVHALRKLSVQNRDEIGFSLPSNDSFTMALTCQTELLEKLRLMRNQEFTTLSSACSNLLMSIESSMADSEEDLLDDPIFNEVLSHSSKDDVCKSLTVNYEAPISHSYDPEEHF